MPTSKEKNSLYYYPLISSSKLIKKDIQQPIAYLLNLPCTSYRVNCRKPMGKELKSARDCLQRSGRYNLRLPSEINWNITTSCRIKHRIKSLNWLPISGKRGNARWLIRRSKKRHKLEITGECYIGWRSRRQRWKFGKWSCREKRNAPQNCRVSKPKCSISSRYEQ